MNIKYDAGHIKQFYDQYGEREWERLESTPENKVNFHVHKYFLNRYINKGERVLEAGAGPGRFTIELAKLGASITVGDISPKQLELNRLKVHEYGYGDYVESWDELDIVDLSKYESSSFDKVVCFGGALSYVFEKKDDAIKELLRVTKPDGYVLISVMSLLGATKRFLPEILKLTQSHGIELIENVNQSGDLYGQLAPSGHFCHMFRWSELESFLKQQTCEIIDAAAANFLSLNNEEILNEVIINDSTLWEQYLKWELEFCREPGAIDGGTHMIAVIKRI
ncbi:MAG TPA: class I SAM-dependent methyltransferase [Bacillus sp. (in: firmicutes)]|uniref:class I SAM-dependent methyltransferase n=1 Tax=Bacillus litorisediminis TaxID=2922713 RepID=UPI001FAF1FDF|nr:class I SAM-dependent methyltransferase [Bacillus litorisediminis]HWO76414.1 class I SAM-dependent methyltransferase [Bacillus sp. (in: firmicutes)]